MENNRMLMASGDIGLQSGNVSSALYDGAQWHPYLVGSTTRGTLGAVSSLFWSEEHFSFNPIKYLARGLVVLVAMAIATGLILLLILLILLGAYCLRRHERKQQPAEVYDEKDGTHSEVSSTHQLIHESVQTALERSLMTPGLGPHPTQLSREEVAGVAGVGAAGVGAGAGAATGAAAAATRNRDRRSGDSFHDDDEYAAAAYDDTSDEGRETVMRYDFFGPELQAGELPMRAGQRVVVLDDEQSGEWWYCRDAESGREGVVPATYLCEHKTS
jgi:cbb3-type cytochrome oxidase subunit 3